MSLFDDALDKRFTEAPEIAAINVTSTDTLLIHDSATGTVMRMPVSILYSALGSAFASLIDGKVPASQLPSFVDDVLEFANFAAFPATGESGKIYIALDTNKTYRWSGSTYVYITSGAVDSVAGKTGVVTLNKSDVGLPNVDNTADSAKSVSYAATAGSAPASDVYSWAKAATKPTYSKSEVGLSNVDNTSDANKPVSTAQQTALNAKANKAGDTFTGQVNVQYDTPIIASWNSNAATLHGFEWKQGSSIDAFFKQLPASGELQLNIGRGVGWGGHWTAYIDTVKIFEARPTTFTFQTGVKLGLGVTPSQLLDINDDSLRLRTAKTPVSATAAGNAGQIAWDASFIYVCVAANTWKRAALSTW